VMPPIGTATDDSPHRPPRIAECGQSVLASVRHAPGRVKANGK